MKSRIHLFLGILLCAVAFSMLAAQQPKKEQIKPELFFIIQEHVKPAMMSEYEAATKQMIRELEQYKISPEEVNFKTVASMDLGYIYVIPLKDFGAMESVRESWMNAIGVIGADRWEEMEATMSSAMESKNAFHAVYLKDLSYEPAKPLASPEEVKFIHYEFFYVVPGKEKQFEALAGKFKEAYTKHNINQGWSFYKQITGDDLPLYVVAEGARSESEYHANVDKIRNTLGSDMDALFGEIMDCIRRMEKHTAMPRPDLSFPNPETMKKD